MSIGPIGAITTGAWPAVSSPRMGQLDAASSSTPPIGAMGAGTGRIGAGPEAPAGNGAGGFLDAIGTAATRLNADLVNADAAMASFAAGGSADLHSVVLQMQEASLQLKLGVQVRDRLLEAYQDIMRLQV